jgi:hypothetical protein
MISIDDARKNGLLLPLVMAISKTEKKSGHGSDGKPPRRKRKPEKKYTLEEALDYFRRPDHEGEYNAFNLAACSSQPHRNP